MSRASEDDAKIDAANLKSAAIAAKWWADRMRDGAGIGDNGGRDPQNNMARGIIQMMRVKDAPTEETCQRFQTELEQRIRDGLAGKRMDKRSYYERYCWEQRGWDRFATILQLDVDYHPGGMLVEALLAAGVSKSAAEWSMLPLKTDMTISARVVEVRHGYGAKWTELHRAWGCSIAEFDRSQSHRRRIYERGYIEWRRDVTARLGNTHYETLEAAEEKDYGAIERWQGPVQDWLEPPADPWIAEYAREDAEAAAIGA